MRKNFYLAALAVLALASCSKSEIIDEKPTADKTPIAFKSYTGGETKAVTVVDAASLLSNGFKATAVYTDAESAVSEYFTNIDATSAKVESTGKGATHGTSYYWPTAGSMVFYAANHAVTMANHAASIVYTANNDEDLVAAKTSSISCPQTTPVAINFTHLKNQVLFSAKLNTTNSTLKATVTEITIKYPIGGTYTFSTEAWTNNTTLADTPASYVSGVSKEIANDSYTAIDDTKALAFVPTGKDLQVSVKYYVEQTIDSKTTKIADYTTTAKTVDVTANQIGKIIRFNLLLPPGSQPIEFTATATAWDNGTNQNIEVQ